MKKILVVAIVVVAVILVGLVALTSGNAKEDTMINFLTNSTLKDGDSVEFQLTDSNGHPLANQEIVIALDNNGTTEKYSITTDANGTGSLVLNGMADGKYKVNVTYGGNDKYNPSYSVQALIIGDVSVDDAETQANVTSQNQTSTRTNSTSSSASNSSSVNHAGQPSGQSSSQQQPSSDTEPHAGADESSKGDFD